MLLKSDFGLKVLKQNCVGMLYFSTSYHIS